MKKLFVSVIQLIMSALLITGSVSAQKNMARASVATSQPIDTELNTTSAKAGADLKDIHARAIRNFNEQYKGATNVRWHNGEKAILASFEENGHRTTVVYYKNGRWLHTLINYNESQLSEHVKSIVKSNFRNYDITWVTEVHEGDKIMYFVNLENERKFRQVVVCNDEIGIYKDFKKSR
jgi:hypothetical protein